MGSSFAEKRTRRMKWGARAAWLACNGKYAAESQEEGRRGCQQDKGECAPRLKPRPNRYMPSVYSPSCSRVWNALFPVPPMECSVPSAALSHLIDGAQRTQHSHHTQRDKVAVADELQPAKQQDKRVENVPACRQGKAAGRVGRAENYRQFVQSKAQAGT
eukprot:365083-Chlamydomonas_euryale.AAC.37